ncbi:MAG: ANTAR domain-containing protein [Planctomycetaceae bacterium]|nr:ANTAR domain-containing protein [Planctomycetaceae bacterium]
MNIYLCYGDDKKRPVLEEMIRALDHLVGFSTALGRSLIDACRETPPDLLISAVDLPDMNGIDALIECSQPDPIPAIIVSRNSSEERVLHALEDHVMAYLTEPISMEDLEPSIILVNNRFAEFKRLYQENQELKAALESRKWVERAKGILMMNKELSEADAYRMLQRMATDRREKIGIIARLFVESGGSLND